MKGKFKGALIFSIILLLFGTMNVIAFSNNNPQLKIDPRGNPSFEDNRVIDDFKLESQVEVLFEAADAQEIDVLYPIEGFFYITDYLELLIGTSNIANCQYSFEGSEFEQMEYSNDTFHYHYLYDIEDNMNSTEPYQIEFKCIEGETEYNASTYFWINTSELDKYFFRYDIEDWTYELSDISWSGNENGLLEIYRALYGKTDEIYNRVSVFVFDNSSSIQGFIDSEIFGVFENVSVMAINGYNVYAFDDDSGSKYLVWTSGKYLISSDLFFFGNITSVEQNLSSDLVDLYLEKYLSDLRYGICGDGEINILNLEGFNEECDGNIETESCGSDIGECSIGEIIKECNNNCLWGSWGECTAVGPEEEICDGLDNNCDGNIDEQLICEKPIELLINSPFQQLSSERRIQFNITTNEIVDKITYIDNSDSRPREKNLCTRNCNGYGNDRAKSQSFRDGYHNLTFYAIKDNSIVDEETIGFIVDSKKPRITKTEPRRGFVSGVFNVEFREDNPKELILNYGNDLTGFKSDDVEFEDGDVEGFVQSSSNGNPNPGSGGGAINPNPHYSVNCLPEDRGARECIFTVNLSDYNNQEIEYWFELKDIVGNSYSSRETKLDVDTTSPILNNNDSFWEQGEGRYSRYIYFTFNVTEENFDEINYIDLNDSKPRERRLCSRLKNGICVVKKSFRAGEHNLTISILDDAGNSAVENFNFVV